MPRKHRLIQLPLVGKILLCLLAIVYQGYLIALVSFLYTSVSTRSQTIIEHPVNTNSNIVLQHWTAENMRHAVDADLLVGNAPDLTQGSINKGSGKVAQQQGLPPRVPTLVPRSHRAAAPSSPLAW